MQEDGEEDFIPQNFSFGILQAQKRPRQSKPKWKKQSREWFTAGNS